jgi:hypothetical protein
MRMYKVWLTLLLCTTQSGIAQNDNRWCWPANSPYDQCYIGRKYNYYFCFGNQIVEECTEFPNSLPWPYRPLKADLDFLCFEFSDTYPPRLINHPGGIKMPSQTSPALNVTVWQRGREDDCIENTYDSWKCLCPPSHKQPGAICCVMFEYTDNPLYFDNPARMPAKSFLVVNYAACEIDCNRTTVYLNVSDEYTNYDPVNYPHTPFENFFYTTGGYPPRVYSGSDANYRVVYLCDVIRHEIGHILGLGHHDACGRQGPGNRTNSGIMNAEGVQENAPPASFTQDDVCAYKRLYCSDFVTQAKRDETALKSAIEDNYPNLFITKTTIPFILANSGYAKLEVYNESGNIVETLIDEYLPAGFHQTTFDSKSLPQGTYWYILQVDNKILARKMLLVK